MANYMPQVAKMLGVELGEEFEVGPYNVRYVLLDDGIHSVGGSGLVCTLALNSLLNGEWTIKCKPWKPKNGENYWFVDNDGNIWKSDWTVCGYPFDHMNRYKLGNCYRTEEEAESNRDKWVTFYASDEVLEV